MTEKKSLDFLYCVEECAKNPKFVKGFNRLMGCHLFESDKRAPIVRMIDESTGYQKELDEKKHEEFLMFVAFVWECVWARLPEEAFEK
ncbi:MAG: hypothetical protein WC516_07770 [Patescibacteria group bacterium]|jgi:hypothetical protein